MSQAATVAKPRRTVELFLLILALGLGIFANALVNINLNRPFDSDFYSQAVVMVVLALAVHVSLRFKAKYADPVILPVVVALNGIGLAMIHRLDIATGDNAASRQWLWTGLAVAAAVAVLWFLQDHRVLRRFTYISLTVSAVLLILPLVPGISAGEVLGASVWIRLGSMTFQPGEIAKITLAIFFAGYLSSNRDLILLAGKKVGPLQLPRFRDLGPMITAWLASIGVLVFQHDLGTSILFFGLFMVMIYVATSRISWVVIGVVLMAVGGFFAVQDLPARRSCASTAGSTPSPRRSRPAIGGSPDRRRACSAWPTAASIGTGLGQGPPGYGPVRQQRHDHRLPRRGTRADRPLCRRHALPAAVHPRFPRGAGHPRRVRQAAGLRPVLRHRLQCFVVIGGVTRLIPLTGLTTPFLAAGGSSLLANWIIVGLLLMISDAARRPISTSAVADDAGPEDQGRGGRRAGTGPEQPATQLSRR